MSHLNPTGRFSSRVSDYVRYRPSYPREILTLFEQECGLKRSSTVADIGSGTGLLAKLFLDFGCGVLGIEPNREMREAGEEFLAGSPKFSSVSGRAEATGLSNSSVDLVVAGQAFHWFDAAEARIEFARILREPKWVALIWNEREVTDGFLTGYEELLKRYAPDYGRVDHRQVGAPHMRAFFGYSNWKLAEFPNAQKFDLEGAQGRLRSSSYAPATSDPEFAAMMAELGRLFHEYEVDGQVAFVYSTKVYFGTLE